MDVWCGFCHGLSTIHTWITVEITTKSNSPADRAVAQRLDAGFPPRRPGFAYGQHVGFVVDKAALGQVFSEYRVPCASLRNERGWKYRSTILNSIVYGGEWSASRPAPKPRGTTPGAHCIGCWVYSRAGMWAMEKRKVSCPSRVSKPNSFHV
jgi:hypothetical protein